MTQPQLYFSAGYRSYDFLGAIRILSADGAGLPSVTHEVAAGAHPLGPTLHFNEGFADGADPLITHDLASAAHLGHTFYDDILLFVR